MASVWRIAVDIMVSMWLPLASTMAMWKAVSRSLNSSMVGHCSMRSTIARARLSAPTEAWWAAISVAARSTTRRVWVRSGTEVLSSARCRRNICPSASPGVVRMRVPLPGPVPETTMPCACSTRSASRTAPRPTARLAASSRSVGSCMPAT
ncbi:hypothetical protein MAJHIDBO_01160 [Propionibacterium freudenreichii subsp. shermanii]|nr:hypothetical protein MAJHIDBO_01160 [Propionibacterium freudenreichii subsp. shermanii]SPS08955.1 hypothetical protein MAJHIDBO_01160 [Propionibacterium freudenreichii subsp. shermanii]